MVAPDALLSQVLVAATYPLEIVEAGQWLQRNRNLQGPQAVDAARQQNWDASVQALVAGFPAAGQLVVAGDDITVTVLSRDGSARIVQSK